MNPDNKQVHDLGPTSIVEFVLLMAATMSLVALCIDAMLPAFPDMARDLSIGSSNETQLIISLMFIGLALGQLFYGPLSDSIGRKPAIHAGYAILVAGLLVSMFAEVSTGDAGRAFPAGLWRRGTAYGGHGIDTGSFFMVPKWPASCLLS